MKKIAAITMVRNDDFYLKKWVEYYGRELGGKNNLYIYFDGLDQEIGEFCRGTNTFKVPKIGKKVVEAEKGRLQFLSWKAAELLTSGYDLVIGVDADEFIVVDPKLGKTLVEYLSVLKIDGAISALGLDFGQKVGVEKDITEDEPFLRQRHYAQIGTHYTKPSIMAEPLTWGSGFHRIKGRNFHIAKDLYLFHFGYFDQKRLEDRFNDQDRLKQGWGKHMKRRARAIKLVTELPARKFEKWTKIARFLQTIIRPVYAWNKPAMLGIDIVVAIPLRFEDIV